MTENCWNRQFAEKSPIFNPVLPAFSRLGTREDNWPGLQDYQSLLDRHEPPIINTLGNKITLVRQSVECQTFEEHYEPRIYLHAQVQTRLENWHDFFQVLVWYTFPKIKATLNSLHFHAANNRLKRNPTNRNRSPIENFITLFDECGIVIVAEDSNMLSLIKNFEWSSLFIDNQDAFNKGIEAFVFGHAMYEKALTPYIGMTANAILLEVPTSFFQLSLSEKLKTLDTELTNYLVNTHELSPALLNPYPLLGTPGWAHVPQDTNFYQNTHYFRQSRNRA